MAQTSGDAGLQAFAQSVELALVQAYAEVGSAGTITSPAAVDATTTIAQHHQEHARALGEAAGTRAPNAPNRRLSNRFRADLRAATNETAALDVLLRFENETASTYMFVLGSLEATPALQLAASILPVESEHAVVLAGLVRQPPARAFPSFENQDEAFKPDEFPVS
ncbi:MAG TPA: ferritin-like domain-containing protein [Acidimicrobiia bacterium]|nr:ferritin-like domain-containing protein [Acidimicrobiia bacterium]